MQMKEIAGSEFNLKADLVLLAMKLVVDGLRNLRIRFSQMLGEET